MKMKTIGIVVAGCVGGAALAHVFSGISGQPILTDYAKTLQSAKAFKVDYTIQTVGGIPQTLRVELSKPNLARIETPNSLIVADGKNISTYDKAGKTYMVNPETDKGLNNLLTGNGLSLFQPFFSKTALNPAAMADSMGSTDIGGVQMKRVKFMTNPDSTTVGFFGTDHLLHKAQITSGADSKSQVQIMNTSALEVLDTAPASDFTFTPPSDAKLVTEADLASANWMTDLSKAEALAKQTGKNVFVDFFATWCGPCKMLEAEVLDSSKFKAESSQLVLCRIDVDQQPSIATEYSVDAMPTQLIVDPQGNILAKMVGYGGPDLFYSTFAQYLTSN